VIKNIPFPPKIDSVTISSEEYGVNIYQNLIGSKIVYNQNIRNELCPYFLTGILKITNTTDFPFVMKSVAMVYPNNLNSCLMKINNIDHERNLYLSPGKSCFVAYGIIFNINMKIIPDNKLYNNEYLINNFVEKTEVILQFGTDNLPVKYKSKDDYDTSFFTSDKKIRNLKIPLDIQFSYIDEYSQKGAFTILEVDQKK